MEKLPQKLVNAPVVDRDAVEHAPAVREAVEREFAQVCARLATLVRDELA